MSKPTHQTILLRADANPAIGMGHMMRQLALGSYFSEQGIETHLAFSSCPGPLLERLAASEIHPHRITEIPGLPGDAQKTIEVARNVGADRVITDGYHLGMSFHKIIRDAGLKLAVYDDYGHCEYYNANWVINQNAQTDTSLYEHCEQGCETLLGPEHVVLRKAFREHTVRPRRSVPVAEKLLLSFGGADTAGLTARALSALQAHPFKTPLEVKVIIGEMAQDTEALQALAGSPGNLQIELVQAGGEIIEHLDWADFAVSAGGSTIWELFHLGVPTIVCCQADNQTSNAEQLTKEGILEHIGNAEDFKPETFASTVAKLAEDPERRALFSIKGRQVIDGKGCARLHEILFAPESPEEDESRPKEEVLLESFLNRSRRFS